MTTIEPDSSPYPGLRPFLREESDLFFGREECIATMVDRLEQNRFLAVLGASGSGKSSLVKVGLIEALERGDMQAAGRKWRIVQFKPQGKPMHELARALLGDSASAQQIELMIAFLRRGPRSLLEWCESGQLKPHENLLIFVDQFEELFRYRTYAGREEAEAFVALLLHTKETSRLPVYVTLTMRSEFLGACALIDDLAEAMNDGQFLTPQMTRDQCRAAIIGPARIAEFDVEEGLVNRLLNDLATYSASDEQLVQETNDGSTFSDVSSQSARFARRADQLPLLQHALNGLYNWARSQSPTAGLSSSWKTMTPGAGCRVRSIAMLTAFSLKSKACSASAEHKRSAPGCFAHSFPAPVLATRNDDRCGSPIWWSFAAATKRQSGRR